MSAASATRSYGCAPSPNAHLPEQTRGQLSLGHFGFDLLDHPLRVVEKLVDPAGGGHRYRAEGHALQCEPTQVVDDPLRAHSGTRMWIVSDAMSLTDTPGGHSVHDLERAPVVGGLT